MMIPSLQFSEELVPRADWTLSLARGVDFRAVQLVVGGYAPWSCSAGTGHSGKPLALPSIDRAGVGRVQSNGNAFQELTRAHDCDAGVMDEAQLH